MKINPEDQYPIPCQSPTLSPLWTAEDREHRRIAQGLCHECPLIFECREAGRLEFWGVWGGIDRSRRIESLGKPPTVACNHCGHAHERPVCTREQCVHTPRDCPGFADRRASAQARQAKRRAREREQKQQRRAEKVS